MSSLSRNLFLSVCAISVITLLVFALNNVQFKIVSLSCPNIRASEKREGEHSEQGLGLKEAAKFKVLFLAPSRSPRSLSVFLSVCPSGTNLSKALHLYLSLMDQSQFSLRAVSGQSQVSLRSILDLSDLTSSVRRSLKYFVLACKKNNGCFVQDFLHDQKESSARISQYCQSHNLTRMLHSFSYTYDPKRNFLYCRNHKVISSVVSRSFYDSIKLKVATSTMLKVFQENLSGKSMEL